MRFRPDHRDLTAEPVGSQRFDTPHTGEPAADHHDTIHRTNPKRPDLPLKRPPDNENGI
nr:hypothetical protein GCM10020093_113870 [Planobispora longispora]